MEKIFVFGKSRANGIALWFLAITFLFFGTVANYYTSVGQTENGDIVAIFCYLVSIIGFIFGTKYFLDETQILVENDKLLVKDRFSSAIDSYHKGAIQNLVIRKEEQEIMSMILVFSFSSKQKPWTLFLQPKNKDYGRILLFKGNQSKVKQLVETILKYFDWDIEEDKSDSLEDY